MRQVLHYLRNTMALLCISSIMLITNDLVIEAAGVNVT